MDNVLSILMQNLPKIMYIYFSAIKNNCTQTNIYKRFSKNHQSILTKLTSLFVIKQIVKMWHIFTKHFYCYIITIELLSDKHQNDR